MKTTRMIKWSVLPALIASGMLTGCSTAPVGELTTRQTSIETGPNMTRTRTVRRTIAPVSLERTNAVEPVAERVYIRPVSRIEPVGQCVYP